MFAVYISQGLISDPSFATELHRGTQVCLSIQPEDLRIAADKQQLLVCIMDCSALLD